MIWLGGIIDLLLLLVFASSNIALRLPSRARVAEQFEKAGKAHLLDRIWAVRAELLLASAAIRTAAVLSLVLIVLHLLESTTWAPPVRYLSAFAIAWTLVLVFSVAIPSAVAKYTGESLLLRLSHVLFVTRFALSPLVSALSVIDPLVRRLAGVPMTDDANGADEVGREILNVVSEGEKQGAVDEQEKEMIESILELRDTEVYEIMTPRTEIISVEDTTPLDQVRATVIEHGHSRVPVYQGTIDTIVGILYAKDLLQLDPDKPAIARSVMRPAAFIPESKLVRELLTEFQRDKVHIAIILDEYGGTAGLITIEDIIEELVGEIADEYETPEPEAMVRIDDHTIEVDARMRIDDLNDEWEADLPEHDDYETVGGFVFTTLGRIPKTGERFEHGRVAIEVVSAEPRKVNRLRLSMTDAENGQAA